MKLVTRCQLSGLTITQLKGLYRQTFNALVQSEIGTHERRIALASLETISLEIGSRL